MPWAPAFKNIPQMIENQGYKLALEKYGKLRSFTKNVSQSKKQNKTTNKSHLLLKIKSSNDKNRVRPGRVDLRNTSNNLLV